MVTETEAPIDAAAQAHVEHDRIMDRVGEGAGAGRKGSARGFAEAALRRIPETQLEDVDPDAAAEAVLDAFRFVNDRKPESIAVRVTPGGRTILGVSGGGTVVEASADDRPFLMSTVTAELGLRGYDVVRIVHPIVGLERGADGAITSVLPAREARRRESYVRVEIEQQLDQDEARDLEETIERLLGDVLKATGDFHAMRDRLAAAINELDEMSTRKWPRREIDEAMALLTWFLDDNFLLLGWREYEVYDETVDGETVQMARTVPGSGLGILRDVTTSRYAEPVPMADLPEDLRERMLEGPLVTVSRTNRRSTVRQRERMDYIGIKRVDDRGNAVGELRLLGLFTRKGLSEPSRSTPILRRKLEEVLEREDIVRASHDERILTTLFQALPKDELFQASVDELQATLMGLLQAEERRETRTLIRVEPFTRTVSILVAVPRDRYSPALRKSLTALFKERYNGERVEVDLSLGERAEAIARFSVEVVGPIPTVDRDDLEQAVRDLARSWTDDILATLVTRDGEMEGGRLAHIAEKLPRAYQDVTPVPLAIDDVDRIDALLQDEGRGLDVRFAAGSDAMTRLRVIKPGNRLELSAFLPIVESLGLTVVEEVPHHSPSLDLTLHDFGVRDDRGLRADLVAGGERLSEAILAAWRGQLELDELNRLVADAALSWQQINVLRAYRRYRRQAGTTYTPRYINETVAEHPDVARAVIDYFDAKFRPANGEGSAEGWQERTSSVEEARATCIARIDEVDRLDQDRILRDFVTLVDATVRTNAFRADAIATQADGTPVPYLSLKFDCSKVADLPQPVPYREIFVYSPAVEGIHLRGGPVARGGLRWSDRRDDFRTEVLGLMKAQMSKNAVIVPTGAKGGFVVKDLPEDRDEVREEVARQYVTFIRALLDVTDNIVNDEIVPPPAVVRHDDDDPYLVVAADKGTATFSDTANGVAEDYGFWLGDAFASGGSKGYDHKKLGITARGAWVAVRQHFTELGVDIQTEPIQVIGIGDMSGDVFGNGMLLSRAIKLVAAFDHRDIFLDPDPDPETAYAERERLFGLPRSSWQDYDTSKLSEGGGVFSRDLKAVQLSEPIRQLLRVEEKELSPPALIKAILRAPVDLFWAGGIGTYVKSSRETHGDVGDRANDDIRIDADELRARVVGEGANLSITQEARIQYARRGGRINMDAVDNVAGVDSSDHEVNVKIYLRLPIESGQIDGDERDQLLETVTDDVVAHVLQDVGQQAQRLSLELRRSPNAMHAYERLMGLLEKQGTLHRSVEFLPDTPTMRERADAGAGLTRPELAVLLAYAKRVLTADILDSELPDAPTLRPVLDGYFPPLLVERFGDLLPRHRLRRELISTIVANDLANRMGVTFAFEAARASGRSTADVAAAYWAARDVAQAEDRYEQVESLSGLIPPERVMDLALRVHELVASLVAAYLSSPRPIEIQEIIERDRPLLAALENELGGLGTESQRMARQDQATMLMDDLVEDDLARFLSSTDDLAMVPDIADVATGREGVAVADAFLWIDYALGIRRLHALLERARPTGRWDREQRQGLATDLTNLRKVAVRRAFEEHPDVDEATSVQRFLDDRRPRIGSALEPLDDLEASDVVPLDALAVVGRALRRVVERS